MNTFNFLAAGFYGLCSMVIVTQIIRQKGIPRVWLYSLASVALACHLISVYPSLFSYLSQQLSLTDIGSTLWLIIGLALTLTAYRTENLLLLPIAYCVSAGTVIVNAFEQPLLTADKQMSVHLIVHLTVALLTFSATLLASLYALQVQTINYLLKQRRPLAINDWVPPLMQVEGLLFKLIIFATLLLSGSLLSGILFTDDLFASGTLHKTLLSFIAWLLFIGVLVARFGFHVRGKRISFGTIAATFVLSMAYFGSRFVKEVILT